MNMEKENVRELFSELFENPFHHLQIHMVPPFVDEKSPTFHLKFMVKKFTDAEKFVRSRRQCSGYFKRVSSRLVTSSRSLPEIVLGTKSRKAFGYFGERSKPRLSLKVSRDCILRSCKGSSFHIVNVAQPHEIHSCPEFLASYPCVALIKFPVLDLRL